MKESRSMVAIVQYLSNFVLKHKLNHKIHIRIQICINSTVRYELIYTQLEWLIISSLLYVLHPAKGMFLWHQQVTPFIQKVKIIFNNK